MSIVQDTNKFLKKKYNCLGIRIPFEDSHKEDITIL